MVLLNIPCYVHYKYGATSGIGKVTALELAKRGHAVYMLVRDTEKGEQVKREIITQSGNEYIEVIRCDVSSLQSVREAAKELRVRLTGIHVLINNAGSAFLEKQFSADGFELTFAVNHLGHFFLTKSLLPLLEKGQARVINVSSEAHKNAGPNFDDLKWEQRPYQGFMAYSISKLYNIFFTKSLAEKYRDKGITAYALHPGVVNTNIWASAGGFLRLMVWALKPFMISAEKGARTTIYLATQPNLEAKSGLYFKKCRVAKASSAADDAAARTRLWDISEKLVGFKK